MLFHSSQRAGVGVAARHCVLQSSFLAAVLVLSGCASSGVGTASLKDAAAGSITGPVRAVEAEPALLATGSEGEQLPPVPAKLQADETDASVPFDTTGFAQTGVASYYANALHGRRTASGERYDMHALTAAHRTLPLGACVRVTTLSNARSVVVRINDRGPFVRGRVIDLSNAAAAALGMRAAGNAHVKLERLIASSGARGGKNC